MTAISEHQPVEAARRSQEGRRRCGALEESCNGHAAPTTKPAIAAARTAPSLLRGARALMLRHEDGCPGFIRGHALRLWLRKRCRLYVNFRS